MSKFYKNQIVVLDNEFVERIKSVINNNTYKIGGFFVPEERLKTADKEARDYFIKKESFFNLVFK